MKINHDFVLRQVGDKWIAVSVSDDESTDKLFITLNDTGAYIFKLLENDTDYDSVIGAMMDKYDVSIENAKSDLDRFIDIMKTHNVLNE